MMVFRGSERALQLLTRAGLHPSDYAAAGDAKPLAARDPVALVGFGRSGQAAAPEAAPVSSLSAWHSSSTFRPSLVLNGVPFSP